MNDVKLRLSLYVPGAQMLSREDALKTSKRDEYFDTIRMTVAVEANKKKPRTVDIFVETRKSRLVRQNINLTSDAYQYMISTEVPYFSTIKEWKNKSRKERLKVHLDRIAENFNEKSYSFEILDY